MYAELEDVKTEVETLKMEFERLRYEVNQFQNSTNQILSIMTSNTNLLVRQIEQVLILQAQQQQNYEQQENVNQQILNFINSSNMWNSKYGALIADINTSLNNMDTVIQDVNSNVNNLQTLPNELQQAITAIGNIQIFEQVY